MKWSMGLLWAAFLTTLSLPQAAPLGTAITYQGRLSEDGLPGDGVYDFRFALADAESGGNPVGGMLTNSAVAVTDGLFSVPLDFGPGMFTGTSVWLEVWVRTNGSTTFTPLSPRQPLRPAPHALFASSAANAASAAAVPWTGLAGVPPGFADGADNDTVFTAGPGLALVGNQFAVAFGSSGVADLVARSDHSHSGADITSGTVADGRLSTNIPRLDAHQTFTGTNRFEGILVVTNGPSVFAGEFRGDGGGLTNLAGSMIQAASVGSGALGDGAVTGPKIAGGAVGTAHLADGAIDSLKIADGAIGPSDLDLPAFGGTFWALTGNPGTVPDVSFLGTTDDVPLDFRVNNRRGLRLIPARSNDTVNVLAGSPLNHLDPGLLSVTIAGGGAPFFVGGPRTNSIGSDFGTIGGGAGNRIGTNSNSGIISGGFGHRIGDNTFDGTISGGSFNQLGNNSWYTTISGGTGNNIGTNSPSGVISGGWGQRIGDNSFDGTIGGGSANAIGTNAWYVTVAGGTGNRVQDSAGTSTISGGALHIIATNAQYSTIAGGLQNLIRTNSFFATIGGGKYNIALDNEATVAGGAFNEALAFSATIGGGGGNRVEGTWSTIAGGRDHRIGTNTPYATVGGGYANRIAPSLWGAAIAGGVLNHAEGFYSVIGGGAVNTNLGHAGTVPGGQLNKVLGDFGFAAGFRANALHRGSFVWADSIGTPFESTVTDQFNVRSSGGVRFETAGAGMTLDGQSVLAGAVESSELADGTVVDADVSDAANINVAKLGTGIVSTTEFNTLDGVTASVQSQLDGKVDVTGDTMSGTLSFDNHLAGVQFSSTDGRNLPMITMFDVGTQNADRMVIAHSPDFADWGLSYEDQADRFRFIRSGTDVLVIDLGLRRVGVGRLATANALEVEGDASKTTAGSWLANSDRRIKTDVQSVTNALETLNRVRPVSFRYTQEYRAGHQSVNDRRYVNVVAQEFAEVFPDHVQRSGEHLASGDEILQVDTYPLTLYATAAIQELNAKLEEALRRRDLELADLRNLNAGLLRRLEALETLSNRMPPEESR